MQLVFLKKSLLWFNSYLHNRKQCVAVQGKLSDLFTQERGVPQGSILGPLLFSIFINDLPLVLLHCSVHLYADDTVIYTSNPHLTQIQNMLQSDFNALQEWLYSNNLLLNKGKSHTMIFGTKHMFKLKSNNIKIMCNDGTYLDRVDQIKYLGLWLDPELSFKPHIDYILRKVNFGISGLYRSKKFFFF